MGAIDILLVCGGALVVMLLWMWDMFTQPRFLKSWLVWSGALAGMALVAVFRSGGAIVETVTVLVATPVMVAMAQLQYRLRFAASDARAAREVRQDPWGNPRPTEAAPKADDPPPTP